jgi:hypothetical protein
MRRDDQAMARMPLDGERLYPPLLLAPGFSQVQRRSELGQPF